VLNTQDERLTSGSRFWRTRRGCWDRMMRRRLPAATQIFWLTTSGPAPVDPRAPTVSRRHGPARLADVMTWELGDAPDASKTNRLGDRRRAQAEFISSRDWR